MKLKLNYCLVGIVILLIVSCNNNSPKKTNLTDSKKSDTLGYYAARNMRGLSSFKIGESTFKEILNQIKKEIRKDSKRFQESNYKDMPRYTGYQEKVLDFTFDKKGNIKSEFYREDFSSILETEDSKITKSIKMFRYYIDDIEIGNLKLTFYQDTLISIECDQNDEIDKIFSIKYGNYHHKKEIIWETSFGKRITTNVEGAPSKDDKLISGLEENKWENELVKAETYSNYDFEDTKNISGYSYFKIETKNGKILKTIDDYKKSLDNNSQKIQKQKEKELIDKI